eukprot:Colp12_sorted_trinity150504_noHs@25183
MGPSVESESINTADEGQSFNSLEVGSEQLTNDGESAEEKSTSIQESGSAKKIVKKNKSGKVNLSKLTKEELEEYRKEQEKRGVIYLSRIPPFMKVPKLRHLLSQHGEVLRIFLQPEDSKVREKRLRHGGNRKKNFTEGWVEFADKRIAKAVAASLNNTKIGGKKGSYYHDDMWNMKYLSKFKWHHLTEKKAYEKAVRDQRERIEEMQARKENNFYLENVEKSKMIMDMESRRKRKADDDGEAGGKRVRKERSFAQHTVLPEPDEHSSLDTGVLTKVLSTKKAKARS